MKAVIERIGGPLFSIFIALKVPRGFGCPAFAVHYGNFCSDPLHRETR